MRMFLFGAQPKPTISAHKEKHWPVSGPASQCARRIVNYLSNPCALRVSLNPHSVHGVGQLPDTNGFIGVACFYKGSALK